MNENAKKWVGALRSGKYKQGKNYLSKDAQYCCLGVACELYQEEKGDLIVEVNNNNVKFYNALNQTLPKKVTDWLGLRNGRSIFDEGQLTAINDAGMPFNEIANLIESEPKGLFV